MTTDNPIKSWIEERRAIHAAAPGEAWSNYGTPPFEVYDSTKYADGDMGEVLAETRALKVSHAITDAHNMFPRALDALEAVLKVHRADTTYQNVSECENDDEDHEDERHTESEDGTPICLDLPDYVACRSCEVAGEPVEWPCETVEAIQEAISDE